MTAGDGGNTMQPTYVTRVHFYWSSRFDTYAPDFLGLAYDAQEWPPIRLGDVLAMMITKARS